MAGYSKNRETNYEIKYMRKVLQSVDDRILIPESVRGEALRLKLEGVQLDQEPKPNARTGLRLVPRALAYRTGLTCAAAFLLIIALFYGIRGQGGHLISGNMSIEGEAVQETMDEMAIEEAAMPDEAADSMDTGGQTMFSGGTPRDNTAPQSRASMGVGGGGVSTVLRETGKVTYSFRYNDSTDPDKANYPITVEIADNSTGETVTQVDIPDMQSVENLYAYEDGMVLVGMGNTGVVTRCYSVQEGVEPAGRLVVAQEGALYASGSSADTETVYTLTVVEQSAAVDAEVLSMPGSSAGESAGYLVTAIDLTGAVPVSDQKLLEGDITSIETQDNIAVVTYRAVDENGDTQTLTAQLLLSGEGIVLEEPAGRPQDNQAPDGEYSESTLKMEKRKRKS